MGKKETFNPLIVKTAKGSKSYLYDGEVNLYSDDMFLQNTIAVKVKGKTPKIYSFNPFQSSIASRIPKLTTLPPLDIIRFSFKLVCFSCRLISASEAKQFPSILPKPLILKVREDFYQSQICLQVKLAVLRCLTKNIGPEDLTAIGDEFESCGLARTDRIFYTLLWSTHYIDDIIKSFYQAIRNNEMCELTVDGFKRELTVDIVNSFYKTAMYFTTTKLHFIASSNRLSHYDIASELLSKALPSYYWVRPFYTRAHAINYTKAAIRNWVQRLIVYYNDPRRARLIQDEDGFTNILKDFDGLGDEQAGKIDEENNIIDIIDRKRDDFKKKA